MKRVLNPPAHGTVRRCRTCKCQLCNEVRDEQSRKEQERRAEARAGVKSPKAEKPKVDLGPSLARIWAYLDEREMQE